MRRATQSVSKPIQKKTHGDPRRYYVNIEMIEDDEARQKEAQKKKKKRNQGYNFFSLTSVVGPHALLFWLNMFLPGASSVGTLGGQGCAVSWGRSHASRAGFVLFGQEVLQPAVLHFELRYTRLESCVLFGGLAHGAFEGLFALFLLHAKPGAGSRIAAAPVFFGSTADALLLAKGGSKVIARNLRAVLAVVDVAVWR